MNSNNNKKCNVFYLMRKKFNKFTPTQKRIASFFLNIDELAKITKTIPSSIFRFSREIEFNGFRDLQKNF